MATASAAKSPFIASPAIDGFFFFASTSAVLIAWLLAAVFHVNSFYILAGVAVVSNGPHLVSTWSRVYFDRREWSRRPFHIFAVPAAIVAAVALAVTFGGAAASRVLNSGLLFWATWHFVAQNWGILRIYQRRSPEPEDSVPMRLEKPLLMLWVLWCLFHRLYTGPRTLFGTEVIWGFTAFGIDFHPPRPAIDGLLGPILFLLVAFIALRLRDRKKPWARHALLRA